MENTVDKNVSKWEEVLEKETIKQDFREVCFDPYIMETVLCDYIETYKENLIEDQAADNEKWRLIDRLKAVAEQKLQSPQKECVLMLLSTGFSYREIARRLGLSKDMVRRSINKSIEILQPQFNPKPQENFPDKDDQSLCTKRFSIDTPEEQAIFQDFINNHILVSISYSVSGDFREVLVVYVKDR